MLKCTLIGHVGSQPLTADSRSNLTPEGFEPLTKSSRSNSPTNCTLWRPWSTVDSNDNEHLAQNITGRIKKWISKMKNGHLLARLGWVAYKFKLWPGVRYGLAMLAMPLEAA